MALCTTGTMLVRWAREASSGTTPPKTACASWERITRDRIAAEPRSPLPSPLSPPSTTAADVSSHDVSMPSTSVMRESWRRASPHLIREQPQGDRQKERYRLVTKSLGERGNEAAPEPQCAANHVRGSRRSWAISDRLPSEDQS